MKVLTPLHWVAQLFGLLNRWACAFLIAGIRVYQRLLSPIIGNQCRFTPTCSHYGIAAIQTHGAIKGSLLTIWRILRCNPWGGHGDDPVPEKSRWTHSLSTKHTNTQHKCQCDKSSHTSDEHDG